MSRLVRFTKLLTFVSAVIMLSYFGKFGTNLSLPEATNSGNQLTSNNIAALHFKNVTFTSSSEQSEEESWQDTTELDNLQEMKEQAILKQKQLIAEELQENAIDEMSDELPKISVIFSTWRSGSTFMGDLLQSHPATFYHYEPLLHFEMTQIRSGNRSAEALRVLKNLSHCNYSMLDDYVSYGKIHKWLHDHNWRLWQHCQHNWRMCWDPQFLGEMCKLFPYQTMKLVRLRLKFAEDLLRSRRHNLRVVHLVRDPRAVWASRQFPDWCSPSPDCADPKRLCADMVDDFHAANILKIKYPTRFLVIRYEDFSSDPTRGAKNLMKFLTLQYSGYVEGYVQSHTKFHVNGPFETKRKTSEMPFKWKQYFHSRQKELESLESVCEEAMRLWGYIPLTKQNDTIPSI